MAVGFSPDGTKVVSSSLDWTIRIWDLNTGACVKIILTTIRAYLVSFSPCGMKIFYGNKFLRSYDLFNLEDELLEELTANEISVEKLIF